MREKLTQCGLGGKELVARQLEWKTGVGERRSAREEED